MKKIMITTILLTLSIFLFSSEREITLSDFIVEVCKNSHFQEILADELTLAYQEKLSTPASNLVLGLSGEYVLDVDNNRLENGFTGNISLSKLFPLSGTSVGLSYKGNILKNGNNLTSGFTASIEQNIIHDAFGRSSRIEKEIAGIETEVAQFQIIESYETYLATLYSLYLNWYSAYMSLKNAETAYNDSLRLLKNTEEKASYGIANAVDLDKSRLQVETTKGKYIQQKAAYDQKSYKIKQAMQIENADELVPVFVTLTDQIPDYDQLIEQFLNESRTVKIMDLGESKNAKELKIYLDNLLPAGSLFLKYELATTNTPSVELDHTISTGVSFSFNAYNPYGTATLKMKRLQNSKTALSNNNSKLEKKESLKILIDNMELTKRLIEIADKKVKLSESIVKNELKLYEQGRSSLDNIISVYESLYSNQLTKLTYEIEYSLYYLEWLSTTDTLISDNKEILAKIDTSSK